MYRHKNVIDFSANCNPLGPPEQVVEAIRSAASEVHLYPDPLCAELRSAIAKKEGVSAASVFVSSGAAEAIFSLAACAAPERALIQAPTFAEYEDALRLTGCEILFYESLVVEEDILEQITEDMDMVFVCNPNNPTGLVTPKPLLMRMLRRCEEVGARLVVDESFLDFLEDADEKTMADLTGEHPALIVIKAFTKIYAMAGVRLGYCICSDEKLQARLGASTQPWNVSLLAQWAGVAALGCDDYIRASRRFVAEQRSWLAAELEKLGLTPLPSEADFLFFGAREDLAERLLEEGILIRDCSNYRGLGPGYFRISVNTEEENNKLINALRTIIWQDRS